jgi:hypothetical protein
MTKAKNKPNLGDNYLSASCGTIPVKTDKIGALFLWMIDTRRQLSIAAQPTASAAQRDPTVRFTTITESKILILLVQSIMPD